MAEYIERDSAAAFAYNCGAVYVANRLSDKKAFPAADVVPIRHGRCETISDQEYVEKDFSCSECEELICDFDTTVLFPGHNCYYYCPNCGAKMDG